MASFEQAMMDMDHFANHMMSRDPRVNSFYEHRNANSDDDEFFKDLPKKNSTDEGGNAADRSFSSYSYSSSSLLDKEGRRVTSTRRRYEDSNGRLKAVHEREVDGKKIRSVWNRNGKDDEGKHDMICSSGTAEEFEKIWEATPFAKAQSQAIEEEKARKEESDKSKAGGHSTEKSQ